MLFQFKLNCLKKFLLLLLVYLPSIQSDCVITYPSDKKTLPKYEKSFGKYKLRIPYKENPIHLADGEIINGFCDTYFRPIHYEIIEKSEDYPYRYGYRDDVVVNKSFFNLTSIILNCRNNKLVYDDIELSVQTFECMPRIWTIYSAKHPYTWCQDIQNSTTLFLGTKQPTGNYILAAVCYNLEQISLQTVVYNVTHIRRNYFNEQIDLPTTNIFQNDNFDEDLWNFKAATLSDLSETLLQEKLIDLAETDEWLNLANYEVASIVQDVTLEKYFNEYDNILNTIWWRNLRLGNWKRFQKTLANYAQYNKFEIYTGTSGVARYPSEDKWYKDKPLEMIMGFKNETIPAYIWTYLKSYDNLNKEFIIFAYNSPYTEYFTTEKVVFCPDICAEIPWLDEIYPSFRYAFAGTMFCCSTDFIRQTNNLPGFPMEILMARQIETTTMEVETTTVELNTAIY